MLKCAGKIKIFDSWKNMSINLNLSSQSCIRPCSDESKRNVGSGFWICHIFVKKVWYGIDSNGSLKSLLNYSQQQTVRDCRRLDEEPVSHFPRPESADYQPRGQRQETADFSSARGQRPETADSQPRGQRKSSADSRKSSSHSLRQQQQLQQQQSAEETPVLRGLQRSTAFHDANLLQEQVRFLKNIAAEMENAM